MITAQNESKSRHSCPRKSFARMHAYCGAERIALPRSDVVFDDVVGVAGGRGEGGK